MFVEIAHKAYNAGNSPHVKHKRKNMRGFFFYEKKETACKHVYMEKTVDDKLRELINRILATEPSLRAWAKKAGISETTIRKYLSGKTKSLTVMTAEYFLRAKGLSLGDVLENKKVSIPILGTAPQDGALGSQPLGFVNWFDSGDSIFAVRVQGNSMNLKAADGSVAIVDGSQTDPLALVGSLVIIEFENRIIFRKLSVTPMRLDPLSTDTSFEPIYLKESAYKILGKVICIINEVG